MAKENSGGAGARNRRSRFLPAELQDEILVRLPIKSLVRFKSVCKAWRFMFHSQRFIDLYGSRHGSSLEPPSFSTADLMKMVPGLVDDNTKAKQKRWRYVLRVIGPLNGIYCIASQLRNPASLRYSILSGKIALFNPATREYKFTNPFPSEFHSLLSSISSKRCIIHMGFGALKNNSKSNSNSNSNSNSWDYRVVVLINYEYGSADNSSFLVLVYSAQDGVWEEVVHYEPGKRNVGRRKAKEAFDIQRGGSRIIQISPYLEVCPQRFFEGCYYWMAKTAGEDHKRFCVLSFNFAEKSFKLISIPPQHPIHIVERVYSVKCEVFVLHDHLAVIYLFSVLSNEGVRRTVEVGVWMMMDYGVEKSWTKIHTIKSNFISQMYELHGIHYRPLKSGGVRIERLLFRDEHQIVSYDDVGHQVIRVGDPSLRQLRWNTPGISTYIETLERL